MTRLATLMVVCCWLPWITPTAAQEVELEITQIDSLIFEVIDSPENPLSVLEAQVDLEMNRISQSIDLRDDQIEQLRLAGRGDIKRFYDRVEQARRRFQASNAWSIPGEPIEPHEIAMPLQDSLRKGLFGQGSLFQKVVANSLDEQQSTALQRQLSRFNELQAEGAVRLFVVKIGHYVPMTSVQRTKLTELLLENATWVRSDPHYSFLIVIYRFGKVPREKYEAFFNETQMKAVDFLIQAGKQIGEYLEQEGVIDDEE
jgi:hypothetical protein